VADEARFHLSLPNPKGQAAFPPEYRPLGCFKISNENEGELFKVAISEHKILESVAVIDESGHGSSSYNPGDVRPLPGAY